MSIVLQPEFKLDSTFFPDGRIGKQAQAIINLQFAYLDFKHGPLVQSALSGFRKFLAEPVQYKSLWTIARDGNGDEHSVNGYERRSDNQETLNFKDLLTEKLMARRVKWQAHRDWLLDCDKLYGDCLSLAISIAIRLEPIVCLDLCERIIRNRRSHTLRFLSDTSVQSGKPAESEIDRSFLTIAIWEGAGFYFTLPDGTELKYEYAEDKAFAFFGAKAKKLSSTFHPMPHRVATETDVQVSSPRQSIVFFTHI